MLKIEIEIKIEKLTHLHLTPTPLETHFLDAITSLASTNSYSLNPTHRFSLSLASIGMRLCHPTPRIALLILCPICERLCEVDEEMVVLVIFVWVTPAQCQSVFCKAFLANPAWPEVRIIIGTEGA